MPRKAAPKVKKIERDSNGLVKGIDYTINEEGFVDWRKLINHDFLVPMDSKNKDKNPDDLNDKELLVLLHGYKELAQIRGYKSVEYTVTSPSPDYVIATCKIRWNPNFETEGEEVVFSGIGDASISNTNKLTRHFLAATAENRAFVRCVRSFLRINILGKDELGDAKITGPFNADPEPQGEKNDLTNPRHILSKLMNDTGISFDEVKQRLVSEGVEAEKFGSLDDVPNLKVFEYIPKLKALKEKLAEEQAEAKEQAK